MPPVRGHAGTKVVAARRPLCHDATTSSATSSSGYVKVSLGWGGSRRAVVGCSRIPAPQIGMRHDMPLSADAQCGACLGQREFRQRPKIPLWVDDLRRPVRGRSPAGSAACLRPSSRPNVSNSRRTRTRSPRAHTMLGRRAASRLHNARSSIGRPCTLRPSWSSTSIANALSLSCLRTGNVGVPGRAPFQRWVLVFD